MAGLSNNIDVFTLLATQQRACGDDYQPEGYVSPCIIRDIYTLPH